MKEDENIQVEMSDDTRTSHQDWVRSLVDCHAASLTRYAISITGNIESARDVVQETFLRLCREEREKIQNYITPWLFKVCRSRALDYHRKEGRMTPLQDSSLARETSLDPTPSIAAEKKESSKLVHKALDTLPSNQREVIRLKFQNGLSYKEISDVTELSVSNVGFLLHSAIKSIRKELGSHYDLMPKPGESQS